MSEKETKTKTIAHPLEAEFNIESNTTVVEYEERLPTELVDHQEYDDKDAEIEDQFQEVYDKAMDAFDVQSEEAEIVEGKYKARNAEVASTYLNTALAAAKEKSTMKQHKDKLVVKKANDAGGTNIIVASSNDILKAIKGKSEKDITPDET